ncbi:MAG: chromosomal replication initiator protein DnaA [Planctomycetes bacterium]|nr:chromosomal replication initiator protein DnaA [Planctomycetota bacterium]MBI3848261.1 chromosomal replication initiator protein DnaA [Planctomycetota bacterium]
MPLPSSSVSAQEIWAQTQHELRGALSSQQFDTWFRKVEALAFDGSTLELAVPNAFFRDWLREHYVELLGESCGRILGFVPEFCFTVRPMDAANRTETPSSGEQPSPMAPSRPVSELTLNRQYTFENFVVGPGNRLSHAASLAVVEAPARAYNPLFLHGSVGLGKTHLLQAVCHEVLRRERTFHILYLSCETFVNQFVAAIERGELESFRFRYRHVDMLLIDDIHFLANKERTQEEFFHTFNTLYNAHKQIVLSSDSPPKEIPTLKERLVSRFKCGFVTQIDPPCLETRVAIIKKKARLASSEVPDDVALFLAERIDTNIRELEGAVTKLLAHASLASRRVDLALAREAFRDLLVPATIHSIDQIIAVVTTYFNLKKGDLQSKRRVKSIVLPRQLCMYLARKHSPYSLEEIGGFFGGRDHTTVLYAEDKIQHLVETNPETRATVDQLSKKLVS